MAARSRSRSKRRDDAKVKDDKEEDDYISEYESSEEDEESEEESDDYDEESEESQPPPPDVVGGRFRVGKQIGEGSYSEVFLGNEEQTGDEVAVKLEWQKAEKTDKLLNEVTFYDRLGQCVDVPRVHWSGIEGQYNVMVMELLGPSLDKLFKSAGSFSLKTVLMLGIQFIDRLEYVHNRGILYRDIKPHNFVMGIGEQQGQLYILDFGLAKVYIDEDGKHVKCVKKKRTSVTGTVRYSGLNVHGGYDASRRDDLEATGYMLIHFLRGDLPWLGLKATSKMTKHEIIGKKKSDTPFEELCKGFPKEFLEFLTYCRSLKFSDKPDYDYLRRLLKNVFDEKGFQLDYRFDWNRVNDVPRPCVKSQRSRSAPRKGSGERKLSRSQAREARRSRSRGREGKSKADPECQRSRSQRRQDDHFRSRSERRRRSART